MTLYILAGGCDRAYPEFWERLAEVVLREVQSPRILSCMFAHADDNVHARFEGYKSTFTQYFGQSEVTLARRDTLYEQIKSSDVIYLHGGRTSRLLEAIPEYDRFRRAVEGKIVIGSSAGANFLSSICYSPSTGNVLRTSGILPIACLVHYGIPEFEGRSIPMQTWQNTRQALVTEAGEELPVILLPEGQFSVLVQ